MTTEEMQARIIELEAQLEEANTANGALSLQVINLTGELEKVRTFNQELFLKVSTQKEDPEEDPAPEVDPIEDILKNVSL